MTRKSNIYSYYSYKVNSGRTKFKTIACLFCVVFVLFFIFSVFDRTRLKQQSTAYLLVLDKDVNYIIAQEKQREAQEIVSVSYIYSQNNVYYVIGFVYFDLMQAKSMLKKAQEVFHNAEILQQKQIKLKNKAEKSLKKDKKLLKVFNSILSCNQSILKLCEQGKNNVQEFKICHQLVQLKLKFQQDYSVFSRRKDKIYQTFLPYLSIIISLIDNCYNSVVRGENVQEKLKLLYIKIYFAQKELISGLNQM